jgi:hypothetical protein
VKKIILLALIILSATSIQSQDMLGVVSSDYSGVSRSFINPASMMNSRKYFDLLLVSGDIFAQNNYLYVPGKDYSLIKLRYLDFPTYPESGQMFLDDYANRQDKYAFANLRLTGPSAMLIMNRQGFAIHNSFRSITSVNALPYDIAKFMLEGLDFAPQQNVRYTHDNSYTVGSMSWVELGLTYARTLYKQGDINVSIGATAKRLWAYHGVIVNSTGTDYMTPDSDTLVIYKLNATGGMSAPVNYGDNEFTGLQNPVRGKGFAFDLGVSYVRTLESQSTRRRSSLCSFPYEPFLFRIGLSLMDFGFVDFDRNVRRLVFDNVDTVWGGVNSLQFSFIDALLGDISQSITGSPDALLQGSSFSMALPSYLSFQFDYNFENNFLVNVVVVQDLPMLNNRLPRPSYASIAPRYSTDRFEVSLPFSVYRYKEPRMGGSVRFLNFSVGSEKLGSLLGFNDFDGLDFYFAIQFGLTKGDCKRFGAMQNCHAYH